MEDFSININNELPNNLPNKGLLKLKRMHEFELKSIERNNKKLIAIIAHDIKAPMSSIVGFLSLLKDNIFVMDRNNISEYVDRVLHSAQKTFNLLDDILEWAFAEKAVNMFHQEHIKLNDLLTEEIGSIKLILLQKKIKITLKNILAETVFIDKQMIKAVLRNLINNAIKYSFESGEIIIDTKKNKGFVEVSILDEGVGIQKNLQDKIFTKKGYNSTLGTKNEAGSGFGLLLCKEFIDIHNGKIWIISEPGGGSEFKFTLPLSPQNNVT
ncbi:MAG: HAMP domain-containing histidine kinase [Bacteroidales bacterium]|nr:HAMP domain-containing histidine kinase [Bacteroidales bacterium]